ncbi:hypothetical protein C2E25_08020 [Geothermobacter hydrogeniphilus]|uniref:Uncharacterized protein n=1 Tax=Geothermobacter hydrogeniphilus TaxID=1969733 RepID=A0A2K2HAU4_9BACT|nr:hypothetical protein C2E25_08020 [Geothermobacter hydrogeniphilus]
MTTCLSYPPTEPVAFEPDNIRIGQTLQSCSDISRLSHDTVFACTVQLAQRIAARLPPAER